MILNMIFLSIHRCPQFKDTVLFFHNLRPIKSSSVMYLFPMITTVVYSFPRFLLPDGIHLETFLKLYPLLSWWIQAFEVGFLLLPMDFVLSVFCPLWGGDQENKLVVLHEDMEEYRRSCTCYYGDDMIEYRRLCRCYYGSDMEEYRRLFRC